MVKSNEAARLLIEAGWNNNGQVQWQDTARGWADFLLLRPERTNADDRALDVCLALDRAGFGDEIVAL